MRSASWTTSCINVVIALDLGAAGRTDLHEGEFVLIGRTFFEEGFDAAETFGDSLGVVDAIDAHPMNVACTPRDSKQSGALQVRQSVRGIGFRAIRRDADGKGLHQSKMAVAQSPRSAPSRFAIRARDPRYPESCCNGPGYESRSDPRPAVRRAAHAATGRCRTLRNWAREYARKSPREHRVGVA